MNRHYSYLLAKHGVSREALDYKSPEQQITRYACLSDIEPMPRDSSVLDVGCGLGYLCDYLRKGGWLGKYTGVDINPDMITAAREQLPGEEFVCADILTDHFHRQSDYIFCGATIEHRPKFQDPEAYLHNMIRKMFSLAKRGLAFDVFSNRVDYMDEDKLYADPIGLLSFCYGLTGRLTLRNDARPYEFTVYLYVDGRTNDLNIYPGWVVPELKTV